MSLRSFGYFLGATVFALAPAFAQTTDIDAFKDTGNDQAKLHVASGFVCPLFIGHFERDAFGERNPSTGADFCAYSAIDGVYGTITLTPLKGPYDAKQALAAEFTEQEGIGGKIIGEQTIGIGEGVNKIPVYYRTYETAALETLHYRILFSTGTVGEWAIEATVEFATPRDDEKQRDFLNAVYTEALVHIAKLPPPTAPVIAAPVAAGTTPPAPAAPATHITPPPATPH
ncbi:MAG: hypothetical protein ISS15_17865 [Alphaproteobacteria bacterium]|nr:hypothetical protein [Alphaproteobacteria bacterium]MBL6938938.1 hypothetical protein [Alphaproteobacteria bacterium]MBL7099530.1 hypothetical protein [Alphaproteobacteria bacterium]